MKIQAPTSLQLDQKKTAAIAKSLRLKHGLLLTQVAAEMPDWSLSMLYLMEQGKRRWTESSFKEYVETIERIAQAEKAAPTGATKP